MTGHLVYRAGRNTGPVGCVIVLLVFLACGVLSVLGYVQQNQPEPRRGEAMLEAIHVPGSWKQPGSHNDKYYPANSQKPPFREPYNRWTRWYLATRWSLAGAVQAYDAAARAAGWQPYRCSIGDPPAYRLQECWTRPNYVLTVNFIGPTASCTPQRQNCDTEVHVELAERAPD
jgi:hypothetical protein